MNTTVLRCGCYNVGYYDIEGLFEVTSGVQDLLSLEEVLPENIPSERSERGMFSGKTLREGSKSCTPRVTDE